MKNEIKSGALLSYLIIFLTAITGLLYMPYMLRQLGQSEYGLYMLMGSVVGYISILDFGLHNTIYRFVAKYLAEKDAKGQENFLASTFIIYGAISLLTLISGAVLFFNLESIFSSSLTHEEMSRARILFAIMIVNLALSLPLGSFQSIIQGYGKFVFANSLKIARIIIRTITLVGILSLGYKSIAIVVTDSLFNLLFVSICAFYCFFKLGVKIKIHDFNRKIINEIFNYSKYIFILSVVNQFFWRIGNITLGIIANTASVAVYALSINLVMYYQQFALGLSSLFMPKVTGLITQGANEEDLTDLMIRVGRLQLILLGLALTIFIVMGRQFVLLWAGEEYKNVYWIALMIFIPLTVNMTQTIGGVILQAKNMISFKAKAYLLMAGLNIMGCFILGRFLGEIGVGVMTSFSIIMFQVLIINLYYYYKIKLNIKRFFKEAYKDILQGITIATIIGFSLLFLFGDGWLAFFIKAFLLTIIYLTTMWFLAFNSYEKNLFVELIGKGKLRLNR